MDILYFIWQSYFHINLFLINTLWDCYFTDEVTEAQRGKITLQRSHSKQEAVSWISVAPESGALEVPKPVSNFLAGSILDTLSYKLSWGTAFCMAPQNKSRKGYLHCMKTWWNSLHKAPGIIPSFS